MKKGFISLFFLLLIVSLVYAAEIETLDVGENKSINGKTIKIQSINEDKVIFDVDGINGIVKNDSSEVINGAEITIVKINLGFNPDFVGFLVKIVAVCGDGTCDLKYETNSTCCTDCGCMNNITDICIENSCIKRELNECLLDSECDDNDKTTLNSCSGVPRKCTFKPYVCDINKTGECNDNDETTLDECVDSLCRFTPYEELAKCSTDKDCDDKKDNTIDKCEGLPKQCTHKEKPKPRETQQKGKEVEPKEALVDQKGFFKKLWFIIVKIFTF